MYHRAGAGVARLAPSVVLLLCVLACCTGSSDALVDAQNRTLRSINGCECLSECGFTFDLCVRYEGAVCDRSRALIDAWRGCGCAMSTGRFHGATRLKCKLRATRFRRWACPTHGVCAIVCDRQKTSPCGEYSSILQRYRDRCIFNITFVANQTILSDFDGTTTAAPRRCAFTDAVLPRGVTAAQKYGRPSPTLDVWSPRAPTSSPAVGWRLPSASPISAMCWPPSRRFVQRRLGSVRP